MFIHGGYWRSRDPSSYSHMAASLNTRGVDVAIAGYDLCPQVTVAAIIDQMRAACLFMWNKRKQRMMVYGHSAGGHLAACMVATDWSKFAPDAPADLVPSGYAISGVYDLSPLVPLSLNADLRLDMAEATRVSPLFWKLPPGRMFDAVVGGAEFERIPLAEPRDRRRLARPGANPPRRNRRRQSFHRGRSVVGREQPDGRAAAAEPSWLTPAGL